MTDPTKPQTALSAGVAQQLRDIGVPEDKHDAKVAGAKKWWAICGVCVALAIAATIPGTRYALRHPNDVTTLVLIILMAPVALCVLVALFAASQADGEATSAFLVTVQGFVPFLRKR